MKFKVTQPTDKEWNGKRFVETTIVPIDENGNETGTGTKVSFWNGEVSMEGGLFKPTIDGELGTNPKGYPVLNTPKQAVGANFKAATMEKAVERKEQGIARAQDNKDFSIRTSATMGQAVQLALAEFQNPKSLYTLDELIDKWRKWLWAHWDDVDKYPPTFM